MLWTAGRMCLDLVNHLTQHCGCLLLGPAPIRDSLLSPTTLRLPASKIADSPVNLRANETHLWSMFQIASGRRSRQWWPTVRIMQHLQSLLCAVCHTDASKGLPPRQQLLNCTKANARTALLPNSSSSLCRRTRPEEQHCWCKEQLPTLYRVAVHFPESFSIANLIALRCGPRKNVELSSSRSTSSNQTNAARIGGVRPSAMALWGQALTV